MSKFTHSQTNTENLEWCSLCVYSTTHFEYREERGDREPKRRENKKNKKMKNRRRLPKVKRKRGSPKKTKRVEKEEELESSSCDGDGDSMFQFLTLFTHHLPPHLVCVILGGPVFFIRYF
ncbi:hypothetical protein Pfo_012051 [Paulownia fortunei]|nr:hypothetical protein Pfo_012051 [Paulownia fortunei]